MQMTTQVLPHAVVPGAKSRSWKRLALTAVAIAVLVYLPFVFTYRSMFGVRLSNAQLLNLGMTQINLTLIAALGALSLTFLTGRGGLISIGHAALYGVGALAGGVAGTQLGWPLPVVLLVAAGAGAVAGVVAGLPSLRVRGLYFLMSTLALHHIVVFGLTEYQYKFFDVVGIRMPEAQLWGLVIDTPLRWYFLLLPMVVLAFLGFRNTLCLREGRAVMAMRDHELAATSAGIDVRILRLKVFAFSSAVAAVAGVLFSYYLTTVSAEAFNINFAVQFVAMIIIGGMGSLWGAVIGAAVWTLLPAIITGFVTQAQGSSQLVQSLLANSKPQLVNLIFGVTVILFLIYAPDGIAGMGKRLRQRFTAKREAK